MLEFETRADFEKANISVQTENPRYCLMPLRYFGECWRCPVFKSKKGKVCDSAIIVKSEFEAFNKAVEEKNRLIKRLKELDKLMSLRKL